MIRLGKLLGVGLFTTALLVACGGGGGQATDCGQTAVKQERLVTNYSLALMGYAQPFASATTEVPQLLPTGESPVWNRVSFTLKATYQVYSAQRPSEWNLSLFAQAQACSPADPTGKQRVTKLSIKSAHNFNDAYPAGTELLPLFRKIGNDTTALSSLLIGYPAPIDLELKLSEAPQFSLQNFLIQVDLDDGTSYSMTSGDLYFVMP